MVGGVERIMERPPALWTRLNGHAQSQRIVGDGRAPGQLPGSTTAPTRRGQQGPGIWAWAAGRSNGELQAVPGRRGERLARLQEPGDRSDQALQRLPVRGVLTAEVGPGLDLRPLRCPVP